MRDLLSCSTSIGARREGGMSKQEILKHAQVCIDTDKNVSANESYIDHDILRGGLKDNVTMTLWFPKYFGQAS